jgi:5-oxoprolinase (ATP-hydrolysing)
MWSDASPGLVQLSVTIDRREGSAVFDFAGTGPEVYGNTNAPPAVTYSAIIYSLRCMVHQDIPLNQVSTAAFLAGAPNSMAQCAGLTSPIVMPPSPANIHRRALEV